MNLEKYVLKIGDKMVTIKDLYNVLEKLSIQKGDVLCVHSQLYSLGTPLLPREEFLHIIIKVLQDLVGNKGMLIMPTFSYSFCKGEIYDINETPSTVGVLTEYFRKLLDVRRTNHPIFSFAIWGDRVEEYLDIGPDAFGFDSVYGKMLRDNGKLLMLGANKGYTFYHIAEEHINVSHRYFKNFSGQVRNERGMLYHTNVPYFVRDLSIKSSVDEKKVETFLLENGCQKQITFGKGTISIIDCKNMYDKMIDVLRKKPQMFL